MPSATKRGDLQLVRPLIEIIIDTLSKIYAILGQINMETDSSSQ